MELNRDSMALNEDIMALIAETGKIPVQEIDLPLRIYDSGIISSLAMLELMSGLEKRYGIVIGPEELIEDNFRDVRSIIDFVRRKTGGN
ncbi:MAG: acyl carrier protein [Spirochaetales bacterium]|nr:acyl carrier protein [Spirochaetales bacterium]